MRTFASILGRPELVPPLLYGVSARDAFPGLDPLRYLELLFQTPAHILQWREKDLSQEASRACIRRGAVLARSCGKLFIVNSLLDLAREGKADGVHLTSKQGLAAPLSLTDEERGGFLVGKSVHSLQEARAAEAEGADYVLLSPIFSPLSKTVSRPPLGLETLRETTRLLRIPVFALGGVHAGHLDLVHQNGAAGVAGITWLREEVKRVMRLSGPSR